MVTFLQTNDTKNGITFQYLRQRLLSLMQNITRPTEKVKTTYLKRSINFTGLIFVGTSPRKCLLRRPFYMDTV